MSRILKLGPVLGVITGGMLVFSGSVYAQWEWDGWPSQRPQVKEETQKKVESKGEKIQPRGPGKPGTQEKVGPQELPKKPGLSETKVKKSKKIEKVENLDQEEVGSVEPEDTKVTKEKGKGKSKRKI